MDLHGSLKDNLQATLRSVTRYRNQAVHDDTRSFWDHLLRYAQAHISDGNPPPDVVELARKLALELIERDRRAGITPS